MHVIRCRRIIFGTCILLAGMQSPGVLMAQIERLPPADPPPALKADSTGVTPPGFGLPAMESSGTDEPRPWENLGRESSPPWLNDQPTPANPPAVSSAAHGPPGAKPGILQRTTLRGLWLPAMGDDSLGFSTLGTSVTFGFPLPTRESPLLITPNFAVHYLDGPTRPDLPAQTFDSAVEFRWLRQVRPWLGIDVAVAPGYYSDFEQGNSDALRITGRGLAQLSFSPTTRWVLGIIYLDRRDVSLLPAGGVIITPNDATRWELIAPQPRLLRRLAYRPGSEWWGYLGGEFGGGAWAIDRANGGSEEIAYRDFRLLIGLERKMSHGISGRFEFGYVFAREIEFSSDTPDFRPSDTLLARGGVRY